MQLELVDNITTKKRVKKVINRFNTEVYEQIMRFLREHKRSSKNTSTAYEKDIRQFFLKTRNKDIEHLTKEDLIFSIEELEDYQAYLLDDLKLSVSTSNRHITAISECIRHLYRRKLVEDIGFLDIKKPKAIAESYDGLTAEEVMSVAEYVARTGRKKTGKIKRLLVLFSYDTCMRKDECLSLKWSNFGKDDGKMISVRTVGKGNKVMNRKISLELYNELLTIKEEGKDKVFNIGSATVDRMMDDIRKYLKIDTSRRKIVFHSIRKAGAQYIWEKTRDINQVSQALGHASIKTTELYINKNENYGIVGAISSVQGVDKDLFEKVSHKDLVTAIKRLGFDKQMFINLELDKLINGDSN